jgi:hypothetical protein
VPVQKFRSAEEMHASPVPAADGRVVERFLRHCARYWRIAPRTYPRGVFRFKSIEDAQAARERVAGLAGRTPRRKTPHTR